MSTMIQIRNVPDEVHRRLKAKAALSGQSLSNFLLAEIARLADRPTEREMMERLRTRTPVAPAESSTDTVRAERDAR